MKAKFSDVLPEKLLGHDIRVLTVDRTDMYGGRVGHEITVTLDGKKESWYLFKEIPSENESERKFLCAPALTYEQKKSLVAQLTK